MTYCLALKLNEGLVCLADTRTNAGVDNISKYRKLFTWDNGGERVIAMMTAGNLAVTQAVISLLQENLDTPQDGVETLFSVDSMFEVAGLVGDAMQVIQNRYGPGLSAMGESAVSSIILAGHRAGGQPRLFHIYSAGNFIEATADTPYFQIGENKYGKPILDRVISPETPLDTGITAALLSMDSTLRSNLSVGMPLDLAVMPSSRVGFSQLRRIEENDENFRALSEAWSAALRNAFFEVERIRV